jgi:hypothetical protein
MGAIAVFRIHQFPFNSFHFTVVFVLFLFLPAPADD